MSAINKTSPEGKNKTASEPRDLLSSVLEEVGASRNGQKKPPTLDRGMANSKIKCEKSSTNASISIEFRRNQETDVLEFNAGKKKSAMKRVLRLHGSGSFESNWQTYQKEAIKPETFFDMAESVVKILDQFAWASMFKKIGNQDSTSAQWSHFSSFLQEHKLYDLQPEKHCKPFVFDPSRVGSTKSGAEALRKNVTGAMIVAYALGDVSINKARAKESHWHRQGAIEILWNHQSKRLFTDAFVSVAKTFIETVNDMFPHIIASGGKITKMSLSINFDRFEEETTKSFHRSGDINRFLRVDIANEIYLHAHREKEETPFWLIPLAFEKSCSFQPLKNDRPDVMEKDKEKTPCSKISERVAWPPRADETWSRQELGVFTTKAKSFSA